MNMVAIQKVISPSRTSKFSTALLFKFQKIRDRELHGWEKTPNGKLVSFFTGVKYDITTTLYKYNIPSHLTLVRLCELRSIQDFCLRII